MSNQSDYDLATLQLSALCAAADPGRRLWHERAYAARIVAHSFATTGQPLAAHNTRYASAQAIRQLRAGAQAAPAARHADHPLYGLPSEFITSFDFYGEEFPVTVSDHFHPGQPGGPWDPPAGDAAEIIGITKSVGSQCASRISL